MFTAPEVVRLMLDLAGLSPGTECSVLDPACGSGSILLGVEARLANSGVMYGIDLDSRLVELARRNLAGSPVSSELYVGDALKMGAELAARFDVVVSNPPYVAWHRIAPGVRSNLEDGLFLGCPLRGRPQHRDQQPDLALFFVLLSVHALKPGGRMVFLLPPEWLNAERAWPLRAFLARHMTLEWLIEFGPSVRLFAHARDRASQVGTSSMLFVARREKPPAGHLVRYARVDLPGKDFSAGLRALSAHCLEETGTDPGLGLTELRSAQKSWGRARWPHRPTSSAPGAMIPLGELPGVRVMGGHQPRTAWLEWLELDAEARDGLPPDEQRWLFPAIRNARDIRFPVVTPPSSWWVMLPETLRQESSVREALPHLYRTMMTRLEASVRAAESRPERWWLFPNRRNMSWLARPGPRLLAPRTAPKLTVCWDPHQHMIKGTNTMIIATPGAAMGLEVIFGLMNSEQGSVWALEHGRTYHNCAILQEPSQLRRFPVPLPRTEKLHRLLEELKAAVRRLLGGADEWEFIDTLTNNIY